VNSAICVRTPGDIFHRWQTEFGVGGDTLAAEVWKYQEAIESELSAEYVPKASYGRSNELASRGDELGRHGGHVMYRYVKDCAGSGQCLQGCRNERKQSTNVTYIPEVLQRGGSLVSCAPVERLSLDGSRVTGVQGRFLHPVTKKRGGRFEIRARKAVLLGASATHSPALLQRSGIKRSVVGANFRAHPGTGVFGCYDEVVDMNRGTTQGWASIKYREEHRIKLETLAIPASMVASRIAGGGSTLMRRLAEYRHFAMWVQATWAESAGRVKTGWGGQPIVHYTLDRRDMEVFRNGLYLVAKMHFEAGAKKVLPCIYGFPTELGPDDLETLREAPLDPRAYLAILSHLFGGCVMGANPKFSVCDGLGRVHGLDGLVVVDASVFPSTIGVNPQHSIMGLSRHFTNQLLERGT
jgi:choline dehydrogenase-like flavoprotein